MTFHTGDGMMHQLKSFSGHLRGGGEQSDLIDSMQKIAQSQLDNVKSMKKMYQNTDENGFAHSVISFIEDTSALVEATNSTFQDDHLAIVGADHGNDFINFLKNMPDSQITGFLQPQMFDDIIVQMQDVVAVLDDVKSVLLSSSSHHRRLKENLFSTAENENEKPFQFHQDPSESGSNSKTWFGAGSWDSPGSQDFTMHKEFHQATVTAHLPDIGKFVHVGSDGFANRRLKVKETHERRLEAMEACRPDCLSTDVACNCNRLVGCINSMSDYDIAMLFVGSYFDD